MPDLQGCVRLPRPIIGGKVACVDLMVPMSAHRYAMDFGFLFYSDPLYLKRNLQP